MKGFYGLPAQVTMRGRRRLTGCARVVIAQAPKGDQWLSDLDARSRPTSASARWAGTAEDGIGLETIDRRVADSAGHDLSRFCFAGHVRLNRTQGFLYDFQETLQTGGRTRA